MTIYNDRCGRCGRFPGNGKKCKNDNNKRGVVYANDKKCLNSV